MVFLLNPPISSGIYEPFVILGGFFFVCVRQARTSAAFIVARETGDLLRQRRLGGLVSVRWIIEGEGASQSLIGQ